MKLLTQRCVQCLTAVRYRRVNINLNIHLMRCCSTVQGEVRVRFGPSPTGKVIVRLYSVKMFCKDIKSDRKELLTVSSRVSSLYTPTSFPPSSNQKQPISYLWSHILINNHKCLMKILGSVLH